MLYRDYTQQEYDDCVKKCNFTDDELKYFYLKSKDKSIVQISFEMNISERQVSVLASRVKAKLQLAQATSGMLRFPNSWAYTAGQFPPIISG